MKIKDTFEIIITLLVFFLFILFSIYMVQGDYLFKYDKKCLEEKAKVYCESINYTFSSIHNFPQKNSFFCKIDERHGSTPRLGFTGDELEECRK